MKRLVVVVALVALTSGCATPYMTDRRRDAADVLTLTAGQGAGFPVGAKARVGPLQVGLASIHDTVGLRGGATPCSLSFKGGDTAERMLSSA